MRTTRTLDDDVAVKRKAEAPGDRSFRDVVDESLRHGLASQRATSKLPRFKIDARALGELKPGLSLDNVAELIEQVEGPVSR